MVYRQCPVSGLAIFARDTDGLSRAYLGWNHGQETGGVPYPYPAPPPDSPCITPPNFILRDTPSTCPAQPPAAACYSVYCGMLLTWYPTPGLVRWTLDTPVKRKIIISSQVFRYIISSGTSEYAGCYRSTKLGRVQSVGTEWQYGSLPGIFPATCPGCWRAAAVSECL